MPTYRNNNRINPQKRCDLINTFRKLWEQHGLWTRAFIVSTAEDLADLGLVTKRLLRNPIDFANEFKKYYGEKAKQFEKLLTEHLTIAAQLVNAAKAGNGNAANVARKKWYQNADQIAAFLAGINPHWSEKDWQAMLYEHLKLVEEEAVYRLKGQYAADIALYDEIEAQALEMADMMAMGIARQFGF